MGVLLFFIWPFILFFIISFIVGIKTTKKDLQKTFWFLGIDLILTVSAATLFLLIISTLTTIDGGRYEFNLTRYGETLRFVPALYLIGFIIMYLGSIVKFLLKRR